MLLIVIIAAVVVIRIIRWEEVGRSMRQKPGTLGGVSGNVMVMKDGIRRQKGPVIWVRVASTKPVLDRPLIARAR